MHPYPGTLLAMNKRIALIAVLPVAFVLAGAGGALAASHYLITSTKQIAPRVLKQLHGARGAQGPAGSAGAMGPSGVTGESEVTGTIVNLSASSPVGVSIATCPSGDLVLSGGWKGLTVGVNISDNEPTTVNGQPAWAVTVALDPEEASTVGEETFEAVAVCATQ